MNTKNAVTHLFAGGGDNLSANFYGTKLKFILVFVSMIISINQSRAQKVHQKIGTNPTLIAPSAVLELESTTKGFLPPRMTAAQRDAIVSPVAALMVWCTDCSVSGQLQIYNGSTWTNVIGGPTEGIVASVASLNCAGVTHNGTLITNTAASGVSSSIPYTGGNGGTYTAQSITSTGVTGLTATLTAGTLANGSGTLTYTITGTPATGGFASFAISISGQSCTLTRSVGILDRAYGQTINGANNHNFVYFPVTGEDGKTWLNNNLGAHYANVNHANYNPTQQANSANDHLAYGSLFQWGRGADGHELTTWTGSTTGTAVNGTTTTLSSTDTPGDKLFIIRNSLPYDWRSPANNNLWQGVNGTNNPCPVGYRVPTAAELSALVTAAGITNNATAASSSLKLPASGKRDGGDGITWSGGSQGCYWSSSVSGATAKSLFSASGSSSTIDINRLLGFTVRCIKD